MTESLIEPTAEQIVEHFEMMGDTPLHRANSLAVQTILTQYTKEVKAEERKNKVFCEKCKRYSEINPKYDKWEPNNEEWLRYVCPCGYWWDAYIQKGSYLPGLSHGEKETDAK